MERMTSFDGSDIAYLDVGDGPVALLSHGFAADHRLNWVDPGIVDALVTSGRRVLAPDARGHGRSSKPHDPVAYGGDAMVRDIQSLLDELAIDRVDIVGYSMGALVSSRLVPLEPRTRTLVLGGLGDRLSGRQPRPNGAVIARALEADDPASVEDPEARAFRIFAEATGADRLALAAIQRARLGGRAALERITVPTLVINGKADTLVGSARALADRIPGAVTKMVGGDHLTAVNDPAFARSIVEFIDAAPPDRDR